MTVDQIVALKTAGAVEIEMHENGSIKRIVFPSVNSPVRLVTKDDIAETEKAKRNPVRNALDLASELVADKNSSVQARQ